jgi:dihydroorotate dehydrogenase electron transfer subunit
MIMTNGRITGNVPAAPGHFILSIALPVNFQEPSFGQFVMVRNLLNGKAMLSRPFSVYGFHRDVHQSALELLCRVAGRETKLLSGLKAGAGVEVLGPLGNGFTIRKDVDRIILAAGGVGVAPLSFFLRERAKYPSKAAVSLFLGAKNGEIASALVKGLSDTCAVHIATDDGSLGFHGPVTEILAAELYSCDFERTQILACGPTPMTRALARLLEDKPIDCQVSLEERMACGVGACLGCVVPVRNSHGDAMYKRVCKDGPVFDLRELLWD